MHGVHRPEWRWVERVLEAEARGRGPGPGSSVSGSSKATERAESRVRSWGQERWPRRAQEAGECVGGPGSFTHDYRCKNLAFFHDLFGSKTCLDWLKVMHIPHSPTLVRTFTHLPKYE